MEETGCEIISGAPTTLAVKGFMMMIMHELTINLPQILVCEKSAIIMIIIIIIMVVMAAVRLILLITATITTTTTITLTATTTTTTGGGGSGGSGVFLAGEDFVGRFHESFSVTRPRSTWPL